MKNREDVFFPAEYNEHDDWLTKNTEKKNKNVSFFNIVILICYRWNNLF